MKTNKIYNLQTIKKQLKKLGYKVEYRRPTNEYIVTHSDMKNTDIAVGDYNGLIQFWIDLH